MSCIVDLLHSIEVRESKSASNSIIVTGGFMNKQEYQSVVLKLTAHSLPNDNSLEVERKIYNLVTTKMKVLTPHLTGSISSGTCSSSALLDMDTSSNPQKEALKKRWIKLQEKTLSKILSRKEYADAQQELKDKGNEIENMLQLKSIEAKTNMYWVMTSQLDVEGLTLQTFVASVKQNPSRKLKLGLDFDFQIAMQAAQCLCVCEKFGLMHFDLHIGNMFIEPLAQETEIEYIYPVPFRLRTKYKLIIYDYDRGTIAGDPTMYNTLLDSFCESVGTCNYERYVPNFDWYSFLSSFIEAMLKIRNWCELRKLLPHPHTFSNNNSGQEGEDAYFGFACECVESQEIDNEPRCVRCDLNIDKLEALQSPRDFIEHVLDNSKQTYATRIVSVHV